MTAYEVDARAEATLRLLLSKRPGEFVAHRRGYETVKALEKAVNGSLFSDLASIHREWSDERDKIWTTINGECRVATGVRIITFKQFEWAFREINQNNISADVIKKMFFSFPIESICEIKKGSKLNKWIMTGKTSRLDKEWESEGQEAIVWENLDPEWYLEAVESFVE